MLGRREQALATVKRMATLQWWTRTLKMHMMLCMLMAADYTGAAFLAARSSASWRWRGGTSHPSFEKIGSKKGENVTLVGIMLLGTAVVLVLACHYTVTIRFVVHCNRILLLYCCWRWLGLLYSLRGKRHRL